MNTILLRKKTIPGNKKLEDDCFDIFAFIWKLKYLRYENDACPLQHYKIPQKRFRFPSLTMVWKDGEEEIKSYQLFNYTKK